MRGCPGFAARYFPRLDITDSEPVEVSDVSDDELVAQNEVVLANVDQQHVVDQHRDDQLTISEADAEQLFRIAMSEELDILERIASDN